jgi:hypothetical protein
LAIHISSAREIDILIAELSSDQAVAREAAIARLTVIGPRTVERLLVLLNQPENGAAARVAALRALEALGDVRSLQPALRASTNANTDIAVAAIAVVRTFVRGRRGVAAVDRLTAIGLDRAADEAIRLEAIEALGDLDASTLRPLWNALADDPNARVRARAREANRHRTGATERRSGKRLATERLARIAEIGLPDDPDVLLRRLTMDGAAASLSDLHRIVERIRDREEKEPPGRRVQWTRARGGAHVALAKRSSLLGLYDLREALESADAPLPVEFLAALALIGDATCLEAIAVAHARASVGWWREHLADAFHAIVRRKKLTLRNAALKKIQKRWPALVRTT